MSGFSAEWLALREPFDRAARSAAVRDAVARRYAGKQEVAVLDLACGTGSTLRALAPALPMRQVWRLVDHDPALLAHAAAMPRPAGVEVVTEAFDLSGDLGALLARGGDLVTTSALLDLVSRDWLMRLAAAAAARALPVYAALSYDGTALLDPMEADDAAIVAAVNRHQRRDKGLGPALGPDAAGQAIACFESLGYRVTSAQSDWVAGPSDVSFQTALLQGWAAAALEEGTLGAATIDGWLALRMTRLADGVASLRVGHVDFLALPATG